MPERVDSTDPEGVDFGWVMQVTFVLTIVVGAPVWFITAIAVYLYARRREDEGTDTTTASEPQD